MNRKQWMIAGFVVTILLVVGIFFLRNSHSSGPASTPRNLPLPVLVYCTEQQVRPCIVSFSTDANDHMMINILLPDFSFPQFYLKVTRGGDEIRYECQKVRLVENDAYCTGEKIPPGEILHISLVSIRDGILLAEGNLSIIGLAYPTIGIVEATPTEIPVLTEFPIQILPSLTEPPPLTPYSPSYP